MTLWFSCNSSFFSSTTDGRSQWCYLGCWSLWEVFPCWPCWTRLDSRCFFLIAPVKLLADLEGETLHWCAAHGLSRFDFQVGSGNRQFYFCWIMAIPWLHSAPSAIRIAHYLIAVDVLWCSEHSSRVYLRALEVCHAKQSHYLCHLRCERKYYADWFRGLLPAQYLALLLALLFIGPPPCQGKCSRTQDRKRLLCLLIRYYLQRFWIVEPPALMIKASFLIRSFLLIDRYPEGIGLNCRGLECWFASRNHLVYLFAAGIARLFLSSCLITLC